MFIRFMDPYLFWIGAPAVILIGTALAWYSTRLMDGARKFFGDLILLDIFSPRSVKQLRSLWAQWVLVFLLILAAIAGPNATDAPTMAQSGALQVQFVFDVSPSSGAEDYRSFMKPENGKPVPTQMYQFGTRLDRAIEIALKDFLPQLKDNEVGLVTVMGTGYNMWDLTRDHNGALKYLLERFVKVGAAPGGGADYASGLKVALDSFKNSESKGTERFIVLFADGGFTGDREELNKVLVELNKEKVHLLIVGMGGDIPVTVPKYNSASKQRDGAYEGTTRYESEILQHMVNTVNGATLLRAAPGTEHLSFDFPEKAGGLYARPSESNLYPWFLAAAMLVLLSITFGGGGLPKPKLAKEICFGPYYWLKDRLRRSGPAS